MLDEGRLDDRADRLDDYLDERGLEAVWFGRPNGFAWLTGGRNVVDREEPVGVAVAGYDGDFRLVTANNEASRLADEEVPDAFAVESVPWYGPSLAAAVAERSPTPAAADFDVPGTGSVDAAELRLPLSAADADRYRNLGREAATAVEAVCRDLSPDDTERDVAVDVRFALADRDIEAPVALVGGGERARAYRHFTPSGAELGEYAVVSVVGERGGLHASLTRTVAFGSPERLAERHRKAMRVEASALGATRAVAARGGRASDVFDGIAAAYESVDEAGEWRKHHQGGATGYAGREWFAAPDLDRPVETPAAYAYNPTVGGAKSEGTVLVSDDGFEVLTATGEWPTRAVEASGFEAVVERPAVLTLG